MEVDAGTARGGAGLHFGSVIGQAGRGRDLKLLNLLI